MGSPEVQMPTQSVRHPIRKLFKESSEIVHSDKPLRDAFLLTAVRWINRNQDSKFRRQRKIAAMTTGAFLLAGVTGPKVYETAMQVTGKRCLVDQVGGHRVQPENNTIKGILHERHPGYNPIERTVATSCIMERLRWAGRRDIDPYSLPIDSIIPSIKVK